jgi:hypothetical protein
MKLKYLIGILLIIGTMLQFFRVHSLTKFIEVGNTEHSKKIDYISAKNIPKGEKRYLILMSDVEEKNQNLVVENLKEVFGYAKINYDIRTLKSLEPEEVERYETIIVATSNYRELHKDTYYEIKDHVKAGNSLIILKNSYSNPFNGFAGIKKIDKYVTDKGLIFKAPIFPGFKETPLIGENIDVLNNSLLKVTLSEDTDIIATTGNAEPLIFKRNVGEGLVLYVNATFFIDRSINGILLQIISYGDNYFLQNIINTKIVNIDDFPAPLPRGTHKLIYEEYKLDIRHFFRDIWWNDMKKIATEKNLVYTGYMVGTYEDITNSYKFKKNDPNYDQDKIYFGRDLLAFGGDVGIHGYNHQPLGKEEELNQTNGYKNWESKDDMKKSLKRIVANYREVFGDMKPKVYVPPSNMIGRSGKEVLKETIPSIEVLSGLYSGVPEKGVLITKIGWDKDEPSFYDLPRLSTGFIYSDKTMLNIYKGIALHGIVHHFIHPDDILDDERGEGKSWEELKEGFSKYFTKINKKFGFLRAQTTYAGFQEALKIENLKVYTFKNGNKIDIYFENFPGKTYHYLRVRGKKVEGIEGGKIDLLSFDGETTLYLLEANETKVTISIGR